MGCYFPATPQPHFAEGGWGGNLFPPHRHIDRPPSTTSTWPVMKPAAGEHRNATAAATSSALPSRCSGVRLTSSATISSVSEASVSSVRTYPGATALQVMLREPISLAIDLVKPISPALAAA